jgi:hypothetical protein
MQKKAGIRIRGEEFESEETVKTKNAPSVGKYPAPVTRSRSFKKLFEHNRQPCSLKQ